MTSNLLRGCVSLGLLGIVALTAYAGGWATVTVKNMPEYFVAGKPAELRFLVRQHGFSRLDGLSVSVRATAPGASEAKAVITPAAGAVKGQYAAVLTLPKAGDWTIRIETGWPATSPLLPVKAIPEGSPAPAPLSQVARGERLFVSKACITCHVNKEVAATNLLQAGPDLTGRTFPADYLRKFLADPAGTSGKVGPGQAGEMPNQELTAGEIGDLVAYINRERPQVVSKAR
jgi:mono/diheme cytochrome c family protein